MTSSSKPSTEPVLTIEEIVELIRRGDAFDRGSTVPAHENHLTREQAKEQLERLIEGEAQRRYFEMSDNKVWLTQEQFDRRMKQERLDARIDEAMRLNDRKLGLDYGVETDTYIESRITELENQRKDLKESV